jgi:hypothetical protein
MGLQTCPCLGRIGLGRGVLRTVATVGVGLVLDHQGPADPERAGSRSCRDRDAGPGFDARQK